ncbi:MAG TPA: PIN domain-containing protein [Gammaproteobacteria bacterium]|jgi:hypothetical protein
MLKVILDSNVFVERDWRANKPSMKLLRAAVDAGICIVVVPQIVIEEVENKFREALEKSMEKLAEQTQRINELAGEDVVDKTKLGAKLNETIERYSKDFRSSLESLKYSQPSYEAVPQGRLVKRALLRRKPFVESGRGYRDALLWESLLPVLKDDEGETVLVTENHKDFCDKDVEQLHENLVNDLREMGKKQINVSVCRDIQTLIKKVLNPQLELVIALKKQETIKPVAFDFKSWFFANRDAIQEKLESEILDKGLTWWPGEMSDNASIRYVEDPDRIELIEEYQLGKDREYQSYEVTGYITLDLYIHRPDFYWLREQYDLGLEDEDWNDHVVWASAIPIFVYSVSLEIGENNAEVLNYEVKIEREVFGWCNKCAMPIPSDATEICENCGNNLF